MCHGERSLWPSLIRVVFSNLNRTYICKFKNINCIIFDLPIDNFGSHIQNPWQECTRNFISRIVNEIKKLFPRKWTLCILKNFSSCIYTLQFGSSQAFSQLTIWPTLASDRGSIYPSRMLFLALHWLHTHSAVHIAQIHFYNCKI